MFLRETATEERTQALGEMLYTPGGFVWDSKVWKTHSGIFDNQPEIEI